MACLGQRRVARITDEGGSQKKTNERQNRWCCDEHSRLVEIAARI